MINGVDVDDAATSGDSDAATKLFRSQHSFLNEWTQSTQNTLQEDQELQMGNEFRSMHSIDFKFYISELALKYNNSNIATTFNLCDSSVKEWRKQNMLLKQAYYEKNIATRAKQDNCTSNTTDFSFSTSALPFNGTGETNNQLAKVEPVFNAEQQAVPDAVNSTSTSRIRKKSSYSSEYKLKAVAYAEVSTNRAAAREFKVHEKRIREWRKNKEILMNSPKDCRRLKGAGRKPLLNHQLEESLYNWILVVSTAGKTITKVELQQKALELSQKHTPDSKFTASSAWADGFLRRHNLNVKDSDCAVPADSKPYPAPTMVAEEAQLFHLDSLMQEGKDEGKEQDASHPSEDSSSSSIPYTRVR